MRWSLLHRGEDKRHQRGQIFWLIAAAIPVLLGFVGLGVDLGLAYVTKTTLSKAVDSAALTAMKNVNLGTDNALCSTSAAAKQGINAFNVNYTSIPNLSATPTPCVNFSLDANNNTLVNVTASATINTYFIRVFGSSYDTLTVQAAAQAQRNPLVMSLVLDISTSMDYNGGESALPPAVQNFVADFDPNDNDTIDHVSAVTFGSSAVVNVDNAAPFKTPVDNAVAGINWSVTNYTNSQQGLAAGQAEIVKIPQTSNLIRVLVFFTDGWPNIQQDTLTCGSGKGATTANLLYCGCDPGDVSLGLCTNTSLVFFNPTGCNTTNNSCSTPASGCGSGSGSNPNPTQFPDQQFSGSMESLATVLYCGGTAPGAPGSLLSDAMYRSVLVMNDPNPNPYTASYNAGVAQQGLQYQDTYIYAIGMGTAITGQAGAQEYLREIANDPAAATYNSALPTGEADFTDAADLNTVFQQIAAKILLRLAK
jgi:Flp pilus assembly protein TadG